MTKTATCGGCDTRWLQHGNITGHCAERECHRTFTGIKAFDRHQSISSEGRNVCHDPAAITRKDGTDAYRLTVDGGVDVWKLASTAADMQRLAALMAR